MGWIVCGSNVWQLFTGYLLSYIYKYWIPHACTLEIYIYVYIRIYGLMCVLSDICWFHSRIFKVGPNWTDFIVEQVQDDMKNFQHAVVPSPGSVSWVQPASYLLTVTSFMTGWYWICATGRCTSWQKGFVREKQFASGRFGFPSVWVFLFSIFPPVRKGMFGNAHF